MIKAIKHFLPGDGHRAADAGAVQSIGGRPPAHRGVEELAEAPALGIGLLSERLLPATKAG